MTLVVSRDQGLLALVRGSCLPPWRVETRHDWRHIEDIAGSLDVGIVVVDDDVVAAEERSELIANVRVWFPEGLVIYVAGDHSQSVERVARAGGVLSYTAKPVDAERLEHLLRSLSNRTPAPVEPAVRRCAN